ncbi:RNA-binding (RRM/RBD/RNP motifs) family protein [Rhynchospora pubera]|uniref:RNA-binding (RRM/RBD/RNP motifs) family protein n=1 Tax=Rhynchospora pubera TaxID=906938 RepID=A0AAV8FG71_9POAL|nr:RNA-binding (RRM/RBD/RNP motifs) family protein [Rhynchospora pubera]KAJ4814488.1 RNA-binding (RRM/RBD/RNP motifs) family protein [Rhynchospora pubera]
MMEGDAGKLFIGGISWDTNDDRLREYFETFGEVVEAVIMRDRTTGRARGFGFVVFADPAVAEQVVMEKHMIDGRMVEAKKAVPRDDQQAITKSSTSAHSSPGPGRTKKIFVGGLASTVTEIDFRKYFEQFGNITDVVVMYDHNTNRPRGFGFITYDSEEAVDKALYKTFHELNGKTVEVKRAVPKELSPGPNVRSPVGGYNFALNRVNNFLNGYTQGYNPTSVGGYGMRMDGRFGLLSSSRNGGYASFGPGYGFGMNLDPGLNPGIGGSSNFNSNLPYGRQMSPYYSGSSSRYNSSVNYSGIGGDNSGSVFNSLARNLWGNSNPNYSAGTGNSNSLMSSGNGGLDGFGTNDSVNWGNPPVPAQNTGSGSAYGGGGLGYGTGESNFGLGSSNYMGRINGPSNVNASFNVSNNGYGRNYADAAGSGGTIYGDSTWRTASSDLDGSGPFDYGLRNPAADVANKSSAGYIGH